MNRSDATTTTTSKKCRLYTALVIGVGSREFEQDAIDVSEILVTKGYDRRDVHLLVGEDATKSAIDRAVDDVIAKRGSARRKDSDSNDDVVFVFISAHARLADDGGGDYFVVPFIDKSITATTTETDDIIQEYHCIDMSALRKTALQSPVGSVMVVLDTCYSGSFLKHGVRKTRRSRKHGSDNRRVFLASSSPSQVSKYVPGGRNSVLTGVLLLVLRGGGVGELQRFAEETAGLEKGGKWMEGVDGELLKRWEGGEMLQVSVVCQLVAELLEMGLSPVLDYQRVLFEEHGIGFVVLPSLVSNAPLTTISRKHKKTVEKTVNN